MEGLTKEQSDAYLARIGLSETPQTDEEGLRTLLWAHLTQVPFENLTVFEEKQVPSLETEDLYRKIVERCRGGYCFELNKLFYLLLRALGFEAWPVGVRIIWGSRELPPVLHRATVVQIEGKQYLADVGYGGPGPKGLLEFAQTVQTVRGIRFRVTVPREGFVQVERECPKGFAPMLLFENRPVPETDFITPNFFCARKEDGLFVQRRVVFRCTEIGSLSLTDSVLTVEEKGEETETVLETEEQLRECLQRYFGL